MERPYSETADSIAKNAQAYLDDLGRILRIRQDLERGLRVLANEATALAERAVDRHGEGTVIVVETTERDKVLEVLRITIGSTVLVFTLTADARIEAHAETLNGERITVTFSANDARVDFHQFLRAMSTGTQDWGTVSLLVFRVDEVEGSVLVVAFVDVIAKLLQDARERVQATLAKSAECAYGDEHARP